MDEGRKWDVRMVHMLPFHSIDNEREGNARRGAWMIGLSSLGRDGLGLGLLRGFVWESWSVLVCNLSFTGCVVIYEYVTGNTTTWCIIWWTGDMMLLWSVRWSCKLSLPSKKQCCLISITNQPPKTTRTSLSDNLPDAVFFSMYSLSSIKTYGRNLIWKHSKINCPGSWCWKCRPLGLPHSMWLQYILLL